MLHRPTFRCVVRCRRIVGGSGLSSSCWVAANDSTEKSLPTHLKVAVTCAVCTHYIRSEQSHGRQHQRQLSDTPPALRLDKKNEHVSNSVGGRLVASQVGPRSATGAMHCHHRFAALNSLGFESQLSFTIPVSQFQPCTSHLNYSARRGE